MPNRLKIDDPTSSDKRAFDLRIAEIEDAPKIAVVFDAYRQFYGQTSDLELALRFIEERIRKSESVIIMALDSSSSELLGLAQLYKGFSSVGAYNYTIFNDLYVVPHARQSGIASALISAVDEQANSNRSKKITLETAPENYAAQSLYTKAGYQKQPSGANDEYYNFVKFL